MKLKTEFKHIELEWYTVNNAKIKRYTVRSKEKYSLKSKGNYCYGHISAFDDDEINPDYDNFAPSTFVFKIWDDYEGGYLKLDAGSLRDIANALDELNEGLKTT